MLAAGEPPTSLQQHCLLRLIWCIPCAGSTASTSHPTGHTPCTPTLHPLSLQLLQGGAAAAAPKGYPYIDWGYISGPNTSDCYGWSAEDGAFMNVTEHVTAEPAGQCPAGQPAMALI